MYSVVCQLFLRERARHGYNVNDFGMVSSLEHVEVVDQYMFDQLIR